MWSQALRGASGLAPLRKPNATVCFDLEPACHCHPNPRISGYVCCPALVPWMMERIICPKRLLEDTSWLFEDLGSNRPCLIRDGSLCHTPARPLSTPLALRSAFATLSLWCFLGAKTCFWPCFLYPVDGHFSHRKMDCFFYVPHVSTCPVRKALCLQEPWGRQVCDPGLFSAF